jgi:AcrR family transcriptional regulator
MTADAVRRRAPFGDNPSVGRRGRETRERIVEATVSVLADQGYNRCSVDRITKRAGCSRVAFYQYFSSRDDVIRQLAADVVEQVQDIVDRLDPLTPDARGWHSIRAWVTAYGDLYERYGGLFHALRVAIDSTEDVGAIRAGIVARNVAQVRSKLADSALAVPHLDVVLELLTETIGWAHTTVDIMRTAQPRAVPREQLENALADVLHRTLFGIDPVVSVHAAAGRLPPIPLDPVLAHLLVEGSAAVHDDGASTVDGLLRAGRSTLLARGYFATRIDDIVSAAGVSHGAFYRYFTNKADFTRVLVVRAMRPLWATLTELPIADEAGAPSRTDLRRWLQRFNRVRAEDAAVLGVWLDAALHDPAFGLDAAGALDWGRRRAARALRDRGFGGVDADAVVFSALLTAYGSRPADAALTEATADVVERGLLGR